MRGVLVAVLMVAGCAADMGGGDGDGDGDGVDSRQLGVTVYTLPCTDAYVFTDVNDNTQMTTTYRWLYAEFEVGSLDRDAIAQTKALLCGYTNLDSPAAADCPAGHTCSGEKPPAPTCESGTVKYFEPGAQPGRVQVACGYTEQPSSVTVRGYSWDEVRLVVPE
jgi:hypothetical protein